MRRFVGLAMVAAVVGCGPGAGLWNAGRTGDTGMEITQARRDRIDERQGGPGRADRPTPPQARQQERPQSRAEAPPARQAPQQGRTDVSADLEQLDEGDVKAALRRGVPASTALGPLSQAVASEAVPRINRRACNRIQTRLTTCLDEVDNTAPQAQFDAAVDACFDAVSLRRVIRVCGLGPQEQ